MTDHVLRHPGIEQEITVRVEDGAHLSPEYARAGWVETDAAAPTVQSAEPAATEQAPAALDIEKEN